MPPMAVPLFDRRALPADMVVDRLTMADGWVLRRLAWARDPAAAPRGSLLFLSGRADFGEKYLEAMAAWRGRGWAVTAFDWRGQGGSTGALAGAEPAFALLLDDLAAIVADWSAGSSGPHVVVAHSMGAHLALRLMAERGWRPDAAVLSAPMLDIATGPIPSALAALLARTVRALGGGDRRVWRHRGKQGLRQATLTGSVERYADEGWWAERVPAYAALAPRWAWLDEAYRSIEALRAAPLESLAVPILFLVAARERLVDNAAIAHAAARLPAARTMTFDAAHELLREADPVREAAMAAIDAFFAGTAPA